MEWLILLLAIPYIYLILNAYSGLKKLIPYNSKSEPSVFISVVAACRNEEKNLEQFLSCLASQNYNPAFFEVLIVDDNSTDSTFKIASSFSESGNFKVIRNNGRGKKSALETGINSAIGNIIVTTDADCRAGEDWIRLIAGFFTDKNPDMLICPVILTGKPGVLNAFQEIEFIALQGITAGSASNAVPILCNGANLAFTRDSYLKNKGNLHKELASGDDIFLLQSLKKDRKNYIAWMESIEAAVYTAPAENLLAFIKQRARWISKAGSYDDSTASATAIVTFVTISTQLFLFAGAFYSQELLLVFTVFFFLKSIPDFLVIANRTRFIGKMKLLWYFLPSQLIYPFYVLIVSTVAFMTRKDFAQQF